jgi:hypothetical protein
MSNAPSAERVKDCENIDDTPIFDFDEALSSAFRISDRGGYMAAQKMSSVAMNWSASSIDRTERPNGPVLVHRSFHSDQ